MKTKSIESTENAVVQQAPVAARPISKSPRVAAPDLTVKKLKSKLKVPEAAKKLTAEPDPKVLRKVKLKVVRDSFTMPQGEYLKIAEFKELCLKAGVQVKKSEVLRAGLIALCAMNEKQLIAALSGLDRIKTGRPSKH